MGALVRVFQCCLWRQIWTLGSLFFWQTEVDSLQGLIFGQAHATRTWQCLQRDWRGIDGRELLPACFPRGTAPIGAREAPFSGPRGVWTPSGGEDRGWVRGCAANYGAAERRLTQPRASAGAGVTAAKSRVASAGPPLSRVIGRSLGARLFSDPTAASLGQRARQASGKHESQKIFRPPSSMAWRIPMIPLGEPC